MNNAGIQPGIIEAYGFKENDVQLHAFGNGLINSTWLFSAGGCKYILQKINTLIFKDPLAIAQNILSIEHFLKQSAPGYLFIAPIADTRGNYVLTAPGNQHYRLFPFVEDSHSIDVVTREQDAFEAAAQFGRFTALLKHFNPFTLNITLPDFHNLALRYGQFREAIIHGNKDRIAESAELIRLANSYVHIVTHYEKLKNEKDFITRVTHHDTKISNVLFNSGNKGICVIDLDTTMPGHFISDVGDMMRTYLSPVSEEEQDFTRIYIRTDVFKALASGYLQEMANTLTSLEKANFIYSGKYMIYMQALRFLTDYLLNDVYYGAKYPGQNFVRAGNQFTLLKHLHKQEKTLQELMITW